MQRSKGNPGSLPTLDFDNVLKQLQNFVPDKRTFVTRKKEFINASKQIKQAKDLNSLFHILRDLLNKNLYPNNFVINQLIHQFGDPGFIDYANILYQDAVLKGIADVVTYSSMITAAGKNNCMDRAIAAYENAMNRNIANVVTHSSMIDAAGKNGRIDLAIAAYENAIKRNAANVVTHSSMIDAAGKNGRIDLAIKAYENTTNRSHDVADVVTYNSMIDALVFNNHLEEAEKVYTSSRMTIDPVLRYDNHYDMDLHGFSYGSTYVALKKFIEETPKPLTITIIYGKGLHTRNNVAERAVKKSVIELMKVMEEKYDIILQEDLDNSGKAFCCIQSKSIQEEKKPDIDSNLFFSKPNAGVSVKKPLNPNAAAFTPKHTADNATSSALK